MAKIFNAFLKNTNLVTFHGRVQFDNEGVATVDNKDIETMLLSLPNYHTIEEEVTPDPDPTPEEPVEKSVEDAKEEPKEQPKASTKKTNAKDTK